MPSSDPTRQPIRLGLMAYSLARGDLIPFLGAGASAFAAAIETGKGLPLGRELALELADAVEFPNDDAYARADLARVASYAAVTEGRGRVVEFLVQRIRPGLKPSPLHALLAEVALRVPLLIVTTNYDDLMETALQDVPHDVIVSAIERRDYAGALFHRAWGTVHFEATEPQALALPVDDANPIQLRRTIVFKMHGSIPRENSSGSFVVTEEDYVAYLSGMSGPRLIPPQLRTLMRPRQFLFLGYALRDWNLRVLLHSIRLPLQKIDVVTQDDSGMEKTSYAISRQMAADERKLWEKRSVTVRQMDFSQFVPALSDQLYDIWSKA
jgi:SIR2-like domain